MLIQLFLIILNFFQPLNSEFHKERSAYELESHSITSKGDAGYGIYVANDEYPFPPFLVIVGNSDHYYDNGKMCFIEKWWGAEQESYVQLYDFAWEKNEIFRGITRAIDNKGFIACGNYTTDWTRGLIGYFDYENLSNPLSYSSYGSFNDVCRVGNYYYVCGGTGIGSDVKKTVIKLDKKLTPIDEIYYSYSSVAVQYFSICPTKDGGIVAVGDAAGGHGFIKCDSNLNLVWYRDIGGSSVYATEDGGYIIAGDLGSSMYLKKVDSLGNDEWINFYAQDFLYRQGYDVIQDGIDKGYLLVGSVVWDETNPSDWDNYIVKTDSMGLMKWDLCFSGNSTTHIVDKAFSCCTDGGVMSYVTGTVGINNTNGSDVVDNYDVFLLTILNNFEIEEGLFFSTNGMDFSLLSINRILQSSDKIMFEFNGQNDCNFDFFVYNVLGQRVFSNTVNSYATSFTWDKTDNFGHEVPAGSYFAIVENGMSRFSKPFVIIE